MRVTIKIFLAIIMVACLVFYAFWIQHGQALKIADAEKQEEKLSSDLKKSIATRQELESQIREYQIMEEKLSREIRDLKSNKEACESQKRNLQTQIHEQTESIASDKVSFFQTKL